MSGTPIGPGVRIGHVHLKVADIDRALAFYCGVLGFQLMQRRGPQVAFILIPGKAAAVRPRRGYDGALSSGGALSDTRSACRRVAAFDRGRHSA
jgi:catechol 2,3-dioxygenase-like lactoylglutathione lyase family enzyme